MNVTTCPTPPHPTPPMCTKTHGQIKTVLQLYALKRQVGSSSHFEELTHKPCLKPPNNHVPIIGALIFWQVLVDADPINQRGTGFGDSDPISVYPMIGFTTVTPYTSIYYPDSWFKNSPFELLKPILSFVWANDPHYCSMMLHWHTRVVCNRDIFAPTWECSSSW